MCAALWNFILENEGLDDSEGGSVHEAPVLGDDLPELPDEDEQRLRPTCEKLLELYF